MPASTAGPVAIDSWLEARDWIYGLELLSLDFIDPVYEQLGIGVRFRNTLKGMARDTLAKRHTEEPAPCEILSPRDYLIFHSAQVMPFLEMVERTLERGDTQRLHHWVRYIACTDDHNPWMLYEDVLSSWAAILRKTGKDSIGFEADSHLIAARLRAVTDCSEASEALARQRGSFLTAWDFPFFAERGLLEIPENSDFFPFVDGIELAIRMKNFQDFWQWLLLFAGPTDLRSVGRFASQCAHERHRSAYSTYVDPEMLPPPVDLVPQS